MLLFVALLGVIVAGLFAASNWRDSVSNSHKEKEALETHRHQERMRALNLQDGLTNRRLVANTFLVVFRSAAKAVTPRERRSRDVVRQLLRVVKVGLPRTRFDFQPGHPRPRHPRPMPPKPVPLRIVLMRPVVADKVIRLRIRVTERKKGLRGFAVLVQIPNIRAHVPTSYEAVTGRYGIAKFTIPRVAQLRARRRVELFVRARPADRPVLSPETLRRLVGMRLKRQAR